MFDLQPFIQQFHTFSTIDVREAATFFLTLKKGIFSLVALSPPPLLVAQPLRKELFLRLPFKVSLVNFNSVWTFLT